MYCSCFIWWGCLRCGVFSCLLGHGMCSRKKWYSVCYKLQLYLYVHFHQTGQLHCIVASSHNGKCMGFSYPHGSQVRVPVGMGTGNDSPTRDLQNKPKNMFFGGELNEILTANFVKIIEIRCISPISPLFSMFLGSFWWVNPCRSQVRVPMGKSTGRRQDTRGLPMHLPTESHKIVGEIKFWWQRNVTHHNPLNALAASQRVSIKGKSIQISTFHTLNNKLLPYNNSPWFRVAIHKFLRRHRTGKPWPKSFNAL